MLNDELSYLEEIQIGLKKSSEKEQIISYLEQDAEYSLGIQNATNNLSIAENADDIGMFAELSLQFGIDSTKFEIEWFTNLKSKTKSKGD